MSIDYQAIGARMQAKRKAAGLTQEALAERLEVTVGYVSQVERGISKANLEMFAQICTVLNCDLCYLLEGTVRAQEHYLTHDFIAEYLSLQDRERKIVLDVIASVKANRQ